MALLMALVALLLLALLGAGAVHMVRGDFRRARDELAIRLAAGAADAGAYRVMAGWGSTPHEMLPIGGRLGPDTTHQAGAFATAYTVRTSPTTFWTVSTGSAGDSLASTLARRTVQVAFRLAIPEVDAAAALIVRDSLHVTGSAQVVGSDTTLAGWGAWCSGTSHGAGAAMPDTSRLCDGTCSGGSTSGRITGLPPLVVDSLAADTARFRRFGGEHWTVLTSQATVVLAPGSVVTPAPVVTGGLCDRSRADNWGNPSGAGPCGSYMPLIWARGDVEVRGGLGQGVLLAEGDVVISGGAQLAGVVIAQDDLVSQGSGGAIFGLAMAADGRIASGDHSRLEDGALVRRSRCAVDLALERSARLVPVRHRSWIPLR